MWRYLSPKEGWLGLWSIYPPKLQVVKLHR
jgi:hypothetical protein